jgi:hypothetical protein
VLPFFKADWEVRFGSRVGGRTWATKWPFQNNSTFLTRRSEKGDFGPETVL